MLNNEDAFDLLREVEQLREDVTRLGGLRDILLKAVKAAILFHAPGGWTDESRRYWRDLTGRVPVTEDVLRDLLDAAFDEAVRPITIAAN